MKKILSAIISSPSKGRLSGVLFALLATTSLWAQSFQVGDLCYNITSSFEPYTVEVRYAVFSITTATIPENVTYNDITYSVTSIGSYAFSGCSSLTSVTIPNSVTSIGDAAFIKCRFTSITIPNSVTSIGDNVFWGCENLRSINIPNSVTSIGNHAFTGCSSLTSVTIGNSVTSIGDAAFNDCSSLTSITIPNSVTSIGGSAFSSCSSLTSITIPNSVTSIGDRAFNGCSSLTSIILTAPSVEEFCQGQGNHCVGAAISCERKIQIDGKEVTEITIPNSVTRIGSYAFSYCSALTSITIPNSVTRIGSDAFSYCSALTSITIPNSVTDIGGYAFDGCSSLTSITIPNSVTDIGQRAFKNCTSLNEITIPNSVTRIGSYAFSGCSSLITITLGNSVTNIEQNTFLDCSSLSSVTIPNSVTNIGEWAFENCTSLNEITLPASVKSIDEEAFAGCTKLYDIYCYAMEPPTAYESSFANYNAFLHVPCDNQRVYLLDVLFGNFKYIECIEAETTPTDTVVVTPSFNDAEFIWPSNSSADSYTLAINKDGEVFCTLTFNANGQLTGIAFAPSRNGQHNAPATAQTANGFAFTVTGLDEGANYTYDLLIQDRSGNTLQSYSGEFRTQSTNDRTVTVEYDAAQGQVTGAGTYLVGDTVTLTATPNDGYRFVRWSNEVEDNPYTFVISDNVTLSAEFEAVIHSDVENATPSQQSDTRKLLRDGQLLILRDGKTYNIMGQEI